MPLPPGSAGRWRCVAVASACLLLAACATTEELEQSYQRGIKAARAERWEPAVQDLELFTGQACAPPRPNRHCREAYLALGRGYERRGAPARAWVAFDAALALPPHARDAAIHGDLERAQTETQDQQQESGERGPLIIRYRDEVTDEYTPRSVTVTWDFAPVFTKDKDAAELHSPDFTKIYAASVPPGGHVLVVETAHGCKPGQAVRCAGGVTHQSWMVDTHPHAPTSVEVRAFAAPGDGDAPARPALEAHAN